MTDMQDTLPAITTPTPFQQSLINVIEQTWWTKQKLLTVVQAAALLKVDVSEVETALSNELVIHVLRKKGIAPAADPSLLTNKQLYAANMVLTRADTRTHREKLKAAGVTVSEWAGWMSQPAFSAYVASKAQIDFDTSDHIAYKTVVGAMENGDLGAARLYADLRGKLVTKHEVTVNVQLFLTQAVEVISRYVTPEKMELLADELEQLYSAHAGKPLALDVA